MELRVQQMGDFYEKTHFTMENFKFWEPVKWGLKIIGPKYQKAHPYAKSGQTNRLAYVAVALVWRYTTSRKKVRENRHWKVDVVYNTTRRRDLTIFIFQSRGRMMVKFTSSSDMSERPRDAYFVFY